MKGKPERESLDDILGYGHCRDRANLVVRAGVPSVWLTS